MLDIANNNLHNRLKERIFDCEDAPKSDEECMKIALQLAKEAAERDEVPVGAVIVTLGKIVAKTSNRREELKLATSHAEILAIEEACRRLGGWRLPESTLYVTMEPCCMCAGAIINSRIGRVVYGAPDLRFGAFGSLVDLSDIGLNHKPEIIDKVLEDECRYVLREYFSNKRKG